MQVKKKRIVYLVGQSRIHIDTIENLGNFVEIEVVLTMDQSLEDGQKIMENLLKNLNIPEEDFVEKAYVDLLGEKIPLQG